MSASTGVAVYRRLHEVAQSARRRRRRIVETDEGAPLGGHSLSEGWPLQQFDQAFAESCGTTFHEDLSPVLQREAVDAIGGDDDGHPRRDGLEETASGLRAEALGGHRDRRPPQESPEATDGRRHLDPGQTGEATGYGEE